MEPTALLITAIVSALSALLGAIITAIIALHKLPIERRQTEATTAATWTDAQAVIIANVREENKALRVDLDTAHAAIEVLQKRDREMQHQIRELEGQNRWLVRENTALRTALQEAGIDVAEFRPQK